MLVLSRNEGEGIHFPELDIAVQILRVAGNRIRIGVQAPHDIRVLRSELADRAKSLPKVHENRQAVHQFRNRLNSASLALTIAEKHLERGDLALAAATLDRTLSKLLENSSLANEAVAPVTQDAHREPAETARKDLVSRLGPVRVLLVEDNRSESGLLAELLQLSGMQVETAGNGHEAIARMLVKRPDFVLMDMQMPECDGPETIRRMKGIPQLKDVAIYAVTGKSQQETGVGIGPGGVQAWFQKPVKSQCIIEALQESVGSSLAV